MRINGAFAIAALERAGCPPVETTALLRQTDEPAGAYCDDGGVRIEVGVDDDASGTLDPGEVDSTTFVCPAVGGQTGDPTEPLDETGAPISPEPTEGASPRTVHHRSHARHPVPVRR